MSGKFLIGIIVFVVVVGFLLFQTSSQNPMVDDAINSQEDAMEGAPGEDAMAKEVDEVMFHESQINNFEFEGVLADVTDGEVRGINTEGESTGIAKAGFDNGTYTLIATFEDLPDPIGTDFYEGWIVRKDPFKFISTGRVEKAAGVYTNVYVSGDDLTEFSRYVLTLEPDDNDPAPADHIVEGDMTKN